MVRHPFLIVAVVIFTTVAGGALECSRTMQTPIEAEGGRIYGRMCSVCHGPTGEGYKADQATALGHPDFLASASDAFLRAAITSGRLGTTMSAWSTFHGGPLKGAEIEAVMAYLRSFREVTRVPLNEKPMTGDATKGKEIFARECASCHGARGTGGPNVGIGSAALLSTATNGFLRYAISKGRAPTAMPGFHDKLGDAGVEDVIAHLRALQAEAQPVPPPPPAALPPIPLGPVPLNPKGPEPAGFATAPSTTPADVIHRELARGARLGLLDARAQSDYRLEHIAGAVSVPFFDPTPYLNDLPKDAWLVCYCACPHAESGQLAQRLLAAGFKKITILDEGLGVWRSRNYGTRTGSDP